MLPASWLTFSHLSLVFGLTKSTVLTSRLRSALPRGFPPVISLPANMQEVVKMTRACVARKTVATSGAQIER